MSATPTPSEPVKPRSRAQVWILIGLFFGPLLAAFILYYGTGGWRPHGSTNRGDLITPARPLPKLTLPAATGEALNTQTLQGKWTLIYIGDGQCDTRCREALILTRQTRLALNQDIDRVRRLFLVTGNCCDREYLHQEHGDLVTASLEGEPGLRLLTIFPEGTSAPQQGRIYIVDPLGNLMMSYSPQAPRKALLEDLKKLLRLSHIG
jgi:cytochrome oxidase Cu insertion factor (SCO1/SenC/PrrC family)